MDLKKILPIVQPNDWKEKDSVATRPLMEIKDQPSLLVAFAEVLPTTKEYVTKDRLIKNQRSLEDYEIDAMANLQKQEAGTWQPLDPQDSTDIIALRKNEITCSLILLKKVMQDAHKMLEAEYLHVAIPDRSTILASNDPIALLEATKKIYQEALDAQQDTQLTTRIFVLIDGIPSGILKVPDGASDVAPDGFESLDEELLPGPLCVFFMVAGADGEIKEKSVMAFQDFMNKKMKSASPVVQSYLAGTFGNSANIQKSLEGTNPIETLMKIGETLGTKTPPDIADEIMQLLLELSHEMGSASAGVMGIGSKISEKKEEAICAIETTLKMFATMRDSGPEAEGKE